MNVYSISSSWEVHVFETVLSLELRHTVPLCKSPWFTFSFFSHIFFLSANLKKNDSVNKNRNTCYLKVVSLTLPLIVFRHVLIRNVCSKRLFCWLLWWYVNRWHWLFFFFSDLVKYVVTTKSHFKEKILFPDILKKGFISLGFCSNASCPTPKWFPGFSI